MVPRQLIPENREILEGPEAFRIDDLVILVSIIRRRRQDEFRSDLASQFHHSLKDLLTDLWKFSHRVFVQEEIGRRNSQGRGCLGRLTAETVAGHCGPKIVVACPKGEPALLDVVTQPR